MEPNLPQAPEQRRPASKQIVMDALVLAFSHSKLKDVVGKDALRSVLGAQYMEITDGTHFFCQPVWDLLAGQPGFEAEKAIPPFSMFKTWESKLGMAVELPGQMSALSHMDRNRRATECKIPQRELEMVFDPKLAADYKRTTREKLEAFDTPVIQDTGTAEDLTPAKKSVLGVSIAASVISVVFIAFTLWTMFRPIPVSTINASDFIGKIPAASAVLFGNQVAVTLNDTAWLRLPEEQRRAELTTALQRLSKRNVDTLAIRDAAGGVRATAQVVKGQIIIKF